MNSRFRKFVRKFHSIIHFPFLNALQLCTQYRLLCFMSAYDRKPDVEEHKADVHNKSRNVSDSMS
jgi:hypothetical protein